ncbi:MAG TPA: ABC-F family ATP-binding cassette domain-containing protein [Synergistales bacterium]|nr:ABC-F family ATP-binding cassette domain-containing protein [Synergistales bacterium]
MIRCSRVTLTLGGRRVFDRMTLAIPPGARVGVVGDNGAGKTTLFRLIAGEVSPDEGEVSLPSRWRLGYLPQDLVEVGGGALLQLLKDKAGITSIERELSEVRHRLSEPGARPGERAPLLARHERLVHAYEALDGYGFEAMAAKVLKGLGFRREDLGREAGEFSGGWKMRISLASILLSRPDVLLLDEPTNHLDTESMEWLEGYLASYRGTLMAVSHDRRFLDKLTTSTVEVSGAGARSYPGNFSQYIQKRSLELEAAEKAAREQQKEIARTAAFIERFRYKASKAAQVQSRIRSLAKVERIDPVDPSRRVSMRFPPSPRSGLEVIRTVGVGHSYGEKTVLSGVDLTIRRGERVALVGVNGAGKSTLTRLLSGREKPTRGCVTLGHNVKSAFFSQESAENLDYGRSVWEEIRNAPSPCTEPQRRNLLGCFLFSGGDIEKPVRALSGGEKSRLALLKILLRETNLLILDEPTNHLDMATRDLFQEALLGYGGTIVIVSHDRDFLDDLVTRVIEIREGKTRDYLGNYSYFIEKRAEKEARGDLPPPGGPTPEGPLDPDPRERKRLEAERRNRLYRARKKYLEDLGPLEAGIEKAEKRVADIDRTLSEPATLADPERVKGLLLERADLQKKLLPMLERWEELMGSLEAAAREAR